LEHLHKNIIHKKAIADTAIASRVIFKK